MIIATTESIKGKKIVRILGMARGNTVRAVHIGRDIVALLRNFVGGEVTDYSKLLSEAREQSLDRMIADAQRLGANAIVGVSFVTSMLMLGAAELLAYGTAVFVEDE
jgi:uncharacterized protein YbjQ (UPF0145 family)